jgi:hypothetical protein
MKCARINNINKRDVLVSRGPFSLHAGRGGKGYLSFFSSDSHNPFHIKREIRIRPVNQGIANLGIRELNPKFQNSSIPKSSGDIRI